MSGTHFEERGFAAIGLWNPKSKENVGSVLRAAACFNAKLVAIQGRRYTHSRSDTPHASRHLPLVQVEDLREAVPFDCVPVAVEMVDWARSLPSYQHPESAFYIFGPEDGSLGKDVIQWCRDVIMIPTNGCLNLAASVNVVLYDRARQRRKL